MTKADLIEEVSRALAIPRKESEVIVDTIFNTIRHSLRRADKVEVRGFGNFRIHQRGARVGRNPKTGAPVEVPAKKIAHTLKAFPMSEMTSAAGSAAAASSMVCFSQKGALKRSTFLPLCAEI